jgi:hypothetical protein
MSIYLDGSWAKLCGEGFKKFMFFSFFLALPKSLVTRAESFKGMIR